MRGWRGGAAALLVAAVLLPAPLLLKRRAAAPADEWRRADFDRALDRALAGADDEDLDRALAPRRRLANDADEEPRRRLADAVECSVVTFAWKQDIKTGGTNYKRVKAADIDGDGDAADLVVVDSTPTLTQYLWWFAADTSAGTLTANQITAYAAQKYGTDIAIGDIDDDGDEDIVVVGTITQEIQWYSNSGDGTSFTKMNNYIDKDIAAPVTVYAADVDGDTDLDVVSASQNDNKVVWYQNTDGDGTFAAAATIETAFTVATDGYYAYGSYYGPSESDVSIKAVSVFVADIDGDDKQDVLYADSTNGILAWSEQTSATDWGESLEIKYDTTNKAKWVVAADFDGDNDLDVVAATTTGTIPLYENPGGSPDGTWTERASALANGGDTVTSVEVFDIDGDGDNDVLAAVSHTDHIRVWRNDGAWSFASSIAADDRTDSSGSNGATAYSLVAVDLDADGDLDVVATQGGYVSWYENDCTIKPTPAPSARPSYSPRPTHSFNPTPGPSVSFNPTPRPTFRPTNKQFHCESNVFGIPHVIDEPDTGSGYLGADGCQSIFGVDLDGDYDIDFLSGSTQEVAWYANDGYEDFTKSVITSFTSAASVKKIFAADVDGDGEIDALSASYDDNTIAWYQNDAESFTKLDLKTDASGASAVYATDVDGDLDIDVVGTAENDDSVFWFERVDNSNPATFTERMIAGGTSGITGPDGPSCVIATNIDGLGGVDVIVGAKVANQIILYSNDGSQNFAAQTMYSAAVNIADVFAVQMDGVGGDDVVTAEPANHNIMWYTADNQVSAFDVVRTTVHTTTPATAPVAVYAIDLDGDNTIDVLSADKGNNEVAWYQNDGTSGTGPYSCATVVGERRCSRDDDYLTGGTLHFERYVIRDNFEGVSTVFGLDIDLDGDVDGAAGSDSSDSVEWYEDDCRTFAPTSEPTAVPTVVPTLVPTGVPTTVPTAVPSDAPTPSPTISHPPTPVPSSLPSPLPSVPPTPQPSPEPTLAPTQLPSTVPTAVPSSTPTPKPTPRPTPIPTPQPTREPTFAPTKLPTSVPTAHPTTPPSPAPSVPPTPAPSRTPTSPPTGSTPPTPVPSLLPTSLPTPLPSFDCGAGAAAVSLRYFPSGAAWDESVERVEVLDLRPGDDDGAAAADPAVHLAPRLKLAPSDGADGDEFGRAVAIQGDTVVVGAWKAANSGYAAAGSVYVLRASDGAELAKLTASDAAANDFFGYSVAIDGDTIVVGAHYDDDNGASASGSVYVFQLSTSDEVETFTECTEPGTFTYEGRTLHCVELPSGELVDALEVEGGAKTCKYTDANSCPAGFDIWVPRSYEHAKAVVDAVDEKFLHTVGVYREVNGCGGCTGVAMNSDAYDDWVAADPTRVPWTSVAGKPWFVRSTTAGLSNPNGYSTIAGGWLSTWPSYLGDNGGWKDDIGFNFDDLANNYYCFTDYLCSRNGAEVPTTDGGATYAQVAKLTASDAAVKDYFGWTVAIDGNTVVVGAVYKDGKTGAAYVFRTSDGWSTYTETKLTASDAASGDQFGYSVAVEGDTVVVAAYAAGTGGAVYVFRTSDGWNTYTELKLEPSDAWAGDYFGFSVDIDGGTVVIASPYDDDNGASASGSAYVFRTDDGGDSYVEVAKLTAVLDVLPKDYFGVDVAIAGDTIVVGAHQWTTTGAGKAFVFRTTDGGATYGQVAQLTADDGAAADLFGINVAIDGNAVVVGAQANKDVGGTWAHSGAAYVFDVAAEGPLAGEFIHDGTTPDRVYHCLPADVGCVKLSFEFPSSFYQVSSPALQAGLEVTVAGQSLRYDNALKEPTGFLTFCVFGGRLVGEPTPAPTISSLPTPVPTSLPTPSPSPQPTVSPAPTFAPTPAPSPSPTIVPTAAPTRAPTAAPSAAPTYGMYLVALEIRFDVTYCEECGGYFITFPDGRRRHGRRLASTTINSMTIEEILSLPEDQVNFNVECSLSGITSEGCVAPFPTLLSVTYLPDADAWAAAGATATTLAAATQGGSFSGGEGWAPGDVEYLEGHHVPAACQDLRDFPDASVDFVFQERSANPGFQEAAWDYGCYAAHVGTTSAADCAAAVATDGCCQAPTDSGFNDAGQVAYKTAWRDCAAGECKAACWSNACAGGDCCEESRAIALQACEEYHTNLTGLVDVEPTSKTSYQCVETELNVGAQRKGGSCRTTHFSFDDLAAAANLTVEIRADGGGVTGGAETSISHEFTGAASEEEHTWCVENGEIVFQPTSAPTISAVPTAAPSPAPTPAPTRVPTTPPSSAPTLPPTPEPTSSPTIVPTSFPTLDCPADAPLLLTFRYLPSAADPEWQLTKTFFYDRDGVPWLTPGTDHGSGIVERRDSEFVCVNRTIGCVTAEFDWQPLGGQSGGLAFEVATPDVDVSIGFRPNLDDWKFPFCIENGNLIKNPTASPTISSIPTAVPTSPPSIRPSATPTLPPSPTPTHAPSIRPSAAPTTPPSSVPTTPPSIRPTATPTTPPSSAPTTPPSHAPTPAPTRTPTAVPTSTPTSYPSVACPSNPTDGFYFRTSERFLPDGASWATVTTTVTLDDGTSTSFSGPRPDRDYGCTEESAGCFVVTFDFGDPTISSSLTYEFMTYVRSDDPTDYDLISTSFPPNLQTGSYTFCVEGQGLAREPTPAPTVSSVPTSVPTVPPSRTPTAGPTVPPTPDPTLAPSPLPSFAPTLQPSPAPSTTPTALPTPVPSAACPAPTADWIRVSTRYFPAAADWGGVTITQTLLDGTRRRLGDGRLLQTGGARRLATALTDATIYDAVDAWLTDAAAAESTYGHISAWDTSQVTNMAELFCSTGSIQTCDNHDHTNAYLFNEDISGWDVSQVTSMKSMFNGAMAFDQPLNNWDVSRVEDASYMFLTADSFDQDLSSWRLCSVTTIFAMFAYARAFDQDLSTWCFEHDVMGHSGTFDNTQCAGTYCGVTYGGCEAAGLGCVTTASDFLADRVFECWACDAGCFTLEFAFADGGAGSAALSYEVSAGAETIGTTFKGGQAVESFAFCIDNCQFARQPTSVPTLSLPPTFAPSPAPTLPPSAAPTTPPSHAPTADPTRDPSATPTTPPSPAPTSRPTATPTARPSALPTSRPSPAPTAEPTTDPTAVPTSYPSFACAAGEVRLRWRFDGDWTGVSANLWAEDDAGVLQPYREFPSFPRTAEYDCFDCNFGCFDAEFLFTNSARLTSHELSYVVELHRDDGSDVISTPFEGDEPSEKFRFCLEDCSIARQPTPAPTISLPPTFAPSPAPSLSPTSVPTVRPSAAPTVPPTRTPTAVPTAEPTGAPTVPPTPAPSRVPTATPTALPTLPPTPAPTVPPTPAPSRTPTATPTALPTLPPTPQPSAAPSPAPTAAPVPAPTEVPSPWPSVGCFGDDLLLSRQWLPGGDTYGGITTTFKDPASGAERLPMEIGTRPDRQYYCVNKDIGCFDVKFTFSEPENEPYHSFNIELEGDAGIQSILTGFEHNVAEQTFTFCIEDGVFARMPTPSPTISLPPTFAPSPSPTEQPTSAPSSIPSPAPTLHPSLAPTPAPSPLPSMLPSPAPSPSPTSAPSPAPSPAPSQLPTLAPSPLPSMLPSPSPTTIPTAAPTPAPSPQPSPAPTQGPTPQPSPVPSLLPSPLPSPYPSVACPLTSPPNVLIWNRWLPSGADWAGVVTARYDGEGNVVEQQVGARPDREFECVPCDQGCFELRFTFSAAKQAESHLMGYEIGTPTNSISTTFAGGLAEESYYWCIDKCQLDRVPTQSPTLSLAPTPEPSAAPSSMPVPAPTSIPTPMPVPAPSLVPQPGPTPAPTPTPSLRPTPRPTPGDPSPRPTAGTLRPTYSQEPSPAPTPMPTRAPVPRPTRDPTLRPTPEPSVEPTRAPTTAQPLPQPTPRPTPEPTPFVGNPTASPVFAPTPKPSPTPTPRPSHVPTTAAPTVVATLACALQDDEFCNPGTCPDVLLGVFGDCPDAAGLPRCCELGPGAGPAGAYCVDCGTCAEGVDTDCFGSERRRRLEDADGQIRVLRIPGEPTLAPLPAPTPTPSAKPTPAPSVAPGAPTARPVFAPTSRPSALPTPAPLPAPTPTPSAKPTPAPSAAPGAPTARPVFAPTPRPSALPTPAPAPKPTTAPSHKPTPAPSVAPGAPTASPLAPTPRPSALPTRAPTVELATRCSCPTAFDNVMAEATAIEDANANIVMSENNLGGLGPDSGAEEIRLEGYYRLPDGTVLDMVVRVKDGSTYQSEDTSQNGLYGTGMTALINVKDDTSVTVTVSLEASVGEFEFENQWYMTLYDFDTQKDPARQVEEACIDDDQYADIAVADCDSMLVTRGLPNSCDGTRTDITHTTIVAQAVGFGCDNPLDSHDLTTIQCADCEQCVDTPSNAQYFPVNQKERAVMFQFPQGAESFDVTFSVTCTDCVFTGGRAFHIGTTSNLCEEDTPAPTLAPVPQPTPRPSVPPPTPRPSVSPAPTTLHTCGCPTAFDNVMAEATAIEDANANILMSANNLGGLGPDSGAEEIRLEGYYRLPDGTVLDMVVRVKDGSTYQSEETSQNGLYGDGMTALINVKDDTSVTVTVSLEASVGDFEFENQWYMTLYDFDTQKDPARQVEEACIDDDQYADIAAFCEALTVTRGLPNSCDGTRTDVTHTTIVAQAVGFGCDNPLEAMDLGTIECADCQQCLDQPSISQYFPVNQKERAVMFRFPEGAESFDITFSVTCTDCVFTGGRAFHIGTTSNMCEADAGRRLADVNYLDEAPVNYLDEAPPHYVRARVLYVPGEPSEMRRRMAELQSSFPPCPAYEHCMQLVAGLTHGEATQLEGADDVQLDPGSIADYVGQHVVKKLTEDYNVPAEAITDTFFGIYGGVNATPFPTSEGWKPYRKTDNGVDAAALGGGIAAGVVVLFTILCSLAGLASGHAMDWKDWLQLEVACLASSLDYAFALDAYIQGVPVAWWGLSNIISMIRFIMALTTLDKAIRQRIHEVGFDQELMDLAGPGPYAYLRACFVGTLACTHALDLARLLDIPQLEEIDHPGTMWVDLNAHLTQLILKVGFMAVLGHTNYGVAKIAMVGIVFDLASVADLVHRRLHPRRRRPRPKPEEIVKDFTSIEVETEESNAIDEDAFQAHCAAEIAAGRMQAPHSPRRDEGVELEKKSIVQRICDWCRREEDILADKLSDHSSFDDIAAGEDIGEPLLKPKRRSFARRLLSFVTEEVSDELAEHNIGRKQTGPTWGDLDDEGGGGEALADDEGAGEEKGEEPDDVVVVPGSGALSEDDAGFNEALLAAKVRAAAPASQNAGLDEDDALVNEALLAAKVRAAGAPSPKPAWQVDATSDAPAHQGQALDEDDAGFNEALLAAKVRAAADEDVPRDQLRAAVARAEELVARSRGHPEEPRARELLAEAKAELARQKAPSPAAKIAPAATPPASPPIRREAPTSQAAPATPAAAAPVRHHHKAKAPAPARRPGSAYSPAPPATRPGSAYWAQRAADAPPPPPTPPAPTPPAPPVPPPAEPQYRSDTPTRQTLATVRDATAPPPQAPPRAWATGAATARDTSRTPRPPSYAGTSRTPPRGVAESKSSEPGEDFLADMREAASPASAPARARGAAREAPTPTPAPAPARQRAGGLTPAPAPAGRRAGVAREAASPTPPPAAPTLRPTPRRRAAPADDPRLAQYRRMLLMRLPRGMVEAQMRADGLDPALLDRDATRDGLADASHMDAEL